jgi:hypothetical protein
MNTATICHCEQCDEIEAAGCKHCGRQGRKRVGVQGYTCNECDDAMREDSIDKEGR